MSHGPLLGRSQFRLCLRIDYDLAEATRLSQCRLCGGPLHVSNFLRKPRGLGFAPAEEERRRLSFCCGREGCRARSTPPSVRFLGRRMYVAWRRSSC